MRAAFFQGCSIKRRKNVQEGLLGDHGASDLGNLLNQSELVLAAALQYGPPVVQSLTLAYFDHFMQTR